MNDRWSGSSSECGIASGKGSLGTEAPEYPVQAELQTSLGRSKRFSEEVFLGCG